MLLKTFAFGELAEFVARSRATRDPAFLARARFWIEQFGPRDIREITQDDVEDALIALRQRPKRKVIVGRDGDTRVIDTDQPLAPSSINRYVTTLGGIYRELREMGYLRRRFVSPVRGLGRLKETGGRTVCVKPDDIKRLIAAARLSRNRKLAAFISFAATTGWRRGNIERLRWGDIDLADGFADTERTKNGTAHRMPLLPWVVEELRKMRPETATDGDLAFGASNIIKSFKTALKLAELPEEWTVHSLRHVAASILSQSGAPIQTVAAALNHKTLSMAMRYSHQNTDSLRDSVRRAWR